MLKKLKRKILDRVFRGMEDYEVTLEELKYKQLNGAKIVDVRSEQEYSEEHIDGAINIPEYKIHRDITNILRDKNTEIVVYCQSGHRGRSARNKLVRLGYNKVYNLYGGLDDV
jgi:rhodanese-related sulfurtransferase